MEDRLAELRGVRAETKVTTNFFGQNEQIVGKSFSVFHIRSFRELESEWNTRAYSSTYFATFDEYRVGKKDYWKKRNWVRMEFAEKVWESIERDY